MLGSDGSGSDLLIVPAGGSANPTSIETIAAGQHTIKMDGKAVFRFAVHAMAEGTREAVARAGLTLARSTWLSPTRPTTVSFSRRWSNS